MYSCGPSAWWLDAVAIATNVLCTSWAWTALMRFSVYIHFSCIKLCVRKTRKNRLFCSLRNSTKMEGRVAAAALLRFSYHFSLTVVYFEPSPRRHIAHKMQCAFGSRTVRNVNWKRTRTTARRRIRIGKLFRRFQSSDTCQHLTMTLNVDWPTEFIWHFPI